MDVALKVNVVFERDKWPVNGSLVLFNGASYEWTVISKIDGKLKQAHKALCQGAQEVVKTVKTVIPSDVDVDDPTSWQTVHIEVADEHKKHFKMIPVYLGTTTDTHLKRWHFVRPMLNIHCVLKDEAAHPEEHNQGFKTPPPKRTRR